MPFSMSPFDPKKFGFPSSVRVERAPNVSSRPRTMELRPSDPRNIRTMELRPSDPRIMRTMELRPSDYGDIQFDNAFLRASDYGNIRPDNAFMRASDPPPVLQLASSSPAVPSPRPSATVLGPDNSGPPFTPRSSTPSEYRPDLSLPANKDFFGFASPPVGSGTVLRSPVGQGTVLNDSSPFPFNMGSSMDGPVARQAIPQQSPMQIGSPPPMLHGFRMPRERGTYFGNAGANFLGNLAVSQLGNFFGAADRVANDVNAGMSGLQRAMTNAANRRMLYDSMGQRERMFNRLASALLGGGMSGIRDTSSNLQVGMPSVSTNVTAQPLGLSQILQADNMMRNSPLTNYSPGRSVSPQAQGELNQLLRAQVRDSVPNAERILIDANEPFARDIQAARSNQFLGLGQLLADLQGDQIENQARNLPHLLQMLG